MAETARRPLLGPGRARTKDEASCSCGHVLRVQSRMARVPGLQELVDDVVVLGELLRYDDALRAVVATIYTVVRAVGVSSSCSSHRAQQRTSHSFNRSR